MIMECNQVPKLNAETTMVDLEMQQFWWWENHRPRIIIHVIISIYLNGSTKPR